MKKLAAIFTLLLLSEFIQAEVEVIQPLSFGTIAVLSNDQVETFNLTKEGDVNLSSNLISVTAPQRAILRVSDLAPRTSVIARGTIINNELISSELNTERFVFDGLNMRTVFNTDDTGQVLIYIGGSISTSGNGTITYGASLLSAEFIIDINY